MEDEQKKPAPARSNYKFYKILTLSLGIFVLLICAGYATVEATSSSTFCGSCHEMNPEYNTWKASTHSNIACKECHIQPGIVSYAKAKMNGLGELYKKATNSYTAPIQMPDPIPNSTCERCHNMKDTIVTAPGDLKIPHDKHLAKGILCVQCHSGVAHGDVSDRNVTFKTDYDKWNAQLGKQMMSDVTFTQVSMDVCITCHQARQVSTACKTCHTTGMKPKSHDDPNFMKGGHGQLAQKDIVKCNSCHQYMSDTPIKDLQTKTASQQFLSGSKNNTISAQDYAKENTFCAKCHSKKPASHTSDWTNIHGSIANKDESQCMACHSDKNTTSTSSITSNGLTTSAIPTAPAGSAPACSTCHPALHDGKDFKSGHPIDLTGVTAPSAKCYSCHNKATCEACHNPAEKQTQTQTQAQAQAALNDFEGF